MDPFTRKIALGAAAGGAGSEYWFVTTDNTIGPDLLYRGAADSDGNSYVTGQSKVGSQNSFFIAKFNKTGDVQWKRDLTLASAAVTGAGIDVDSSGNVYAVGYGDKTHVVKYNASGTLQWQREIDNTDSGFQFIKDLAVDSSGNIYITGYSSSSGFNATAGGSYAMFVYKYNSSGTFQWARSLGSSGMSFGLGCDTDGSRVYFTGNTSTGTQGGARDGILAAYNTSGSVVTQDAVGTSLMDFLSDVAVDSSGNIYVAGHYEISSGGYNGLVLKFNSSFTLQWARQINAQSASNQPNVSLYGCSVDSSGNVYVTGHSNNVNSSRNCYVAKFSALGVALWQREFGNNNAGQSADWSGAVDSVGGVYLVGMSSGVTNATSGNRGIFARIPDDGSLTGTYQGITYAASTCTISGASIGYSSASSLYNTNPSSVLSDVSGTLGNTNSTAANITTTYAIQ